MKKLLLSTVICVTATLVVYSQDHDRFIEKGTGILSLDIPFQMSFSKSESTSSYWGEQEFNSQFFSIGPHISGGYFVTRHFMVGASLGMHVAFRRSSVTPPGTVQKNTNPIFLNPNIVVRFYHLFTPKVGFFTQLLAGPTIQTNKLPFNDASNGDIGANVNWGPRLVILPTGNIGINIGFGELGYQYMANRFNGNKTGESHRFTIVPNLTIGASMFLGRK